jgi:hypothetical protein
MQEHGHIIKKPNTPNAANKQDMLVTTSCCHLEDDTMDATGACVYGQQYYLVYPDGDAVQCHSSG